MAAGHNPTRGAAHRRRSRFDRDLQPARLAVYLDDMQAGKVNQQVAAVAVDVGGMGQHVVQPLRKR